jgi:hypothetical protein
MGPHSRQYSMQQSTNVVCDGLALLKLEFFLFITIIMKTIASRFDDGVQKQRDVDETMGTSQPPGRIRRCRFQVDACMCVGVKGSQGGGALGGRNGGIKMRRLIVQLGSRFFFDCAMHNS